MDSQLYLIAVGFALGTITTGIIAIYFILRRQSEFYEARARETWANTNNDLLRAQMRAFQDHALRREGNMMVYNIQKANGRFAKVRLPEIV